MESLDGRDKTILYYLDMDSRQSFSELGKKIGLHKDVIAYRVKKLQEKGIIKKFYTEINNEKLGYSEAKFYLTYQNVNLQKKQEIIEYLVRSPYTDIVHALEGQYDLAVISSEQNITKFYDVWTDIIKKYRDFFSSQVFCVECISVTFKKTFLLDEQRDGREDRVLSMVRPQDEKVQLDPLDYKILELLSSNARIPTLELAETLQIAINTVNARIQKLIKNGVITRFTVHVDWPLIGYRWFKADIVLRDMEKMQKIVEYIQQDPHLLYRVGSLGYIDLELTFILNNENQLFQIMEDVSSKFPDVIKNYKSYSITKTHKFYGADFWNR